MTNRLQTPLFYLFLLVLVLAPLPLGSNREWSWSLCALLVGVIGIGWAVIRTAGIVAGEPHAGRGTYRPYGASMSTLAILFLAVVGWGLFQAQGFAPAGWAHPLWGMASEALNGDAGALAGRISLATDETLTATMRLLSYGLVFVLAFTWGRDERRARRTLQGLVAGGIVYAVYGL